MKFDVVVIGSGPAGSVTARFAAEGGAKVLMIERRSEIGTPILCGEGISKKVEEFGVLEGTRWIASSMDGANIYSPDGTCVTMDAEHAGNETGHVIYRDIFDQELARSAACAGAEIWMDARAIGLIKKDGKIVGVQIEQYGEQIEVECDVVVGADGVESKVGRWAGIDTTLDPCDLETCAQYTLTGVDVHEGYCDFYLGHEIAPGGYIWVFPKGKDVANVGMGILASLSSPGQVKELLDEFISGHPEIAKGQPVRFLTGAVPVAKPLESLAADNVVLIGDAARQVDPITGGGLMASIEAGKACGETIAEAVKSKDFSEQFLGSYIESVELLYKKLKRNYVVKEIMLDMDDKTFNMLAHSLKDYKFEELSTLSLVSALVKKHPSLLVRLKPLLKVAKM